MYNNPNLIPRATGNAGAVPVLIASNGNSTFEGLLDNNVNYGAGNAKHFQAGNQANLENLLLLQSGSMGLLQQYFFAKDVETIDTFQSYSSARSRFRTWRENEASLFFQNDWKITRDLTLNLGLRWEYYGPPWEANGLLPVAKGSNLAGVFGISGDNWDDWWQANPKTNGQITTIELGGPHSPNPDRSLYKKDKNNFGPNIGFAWNIPWFGQGKTVLRGGFSITYQGGGNFAAIDGTASGDVPGAALQATFPGTSTTYLRLADFGTNQPEPDHAFDVQLPGLSLPGGRAAAGGPGRSVEGATAVGAATAPIPAAGRYSVGVLRRQLHCALYPELHPWNHAECWPKDDRGRPLHRHRGSEALFGTACQFVQLPDQRAEGSFRRRPGWRRVDPTQ